MNTKFNVGDFAWIAFAGQVEKSVTCPDCFGQKALTVILGDKSKVSVDCTGGQVGYDPPRGYILIHEFQSDTKQIQIDGIEYGIGQETEYKYEMSLNGNFYRAAKESDLFMTRDEAFNRAEELCKKHRQEELNCLNNLKEQQHRSWAWNATYHRKCLKEALRQVEYHTAKLNVAETKVMTYGKT